MKSKQLLNSLLIFFKVLLFSILVLIYVYIMLWSFCYSLFITYALLLILVFSTYRYYQNKDVKHMAKFLILGLVIFAVAIPFNLIQYNQKSEYWQNKVNNGDDLSFKEKSGVYGTLIMLIVGGYIPFPEVSKENFYLLFPDEDNVRVFHDNTFLNSTGIQRHMSQGDKVKVVWNSWEERASGDLRYALAFNTAVVEKVDKQEFVEYTLTMSVNYTENWTTLHAKNLFGGYLTTRIDEGLFWYLQKVGWLHPYTAIWKGKVKKF